MFYLNAPGTNSRNYFAVKLLDSLKTSKCYYAECFVNLGNCWQLACNNQAMLFTNNPVYVDTANSLQILPATPQVQNPYIVTDTLNWVKIAGVFTAQGGEQYLTLGNFKYDNQTNFTLVNPSGGYYGAGYYVEDVTVVPLDSITLAADAGQDRTINLGDSSFIGSFTTGLTNVNWYNSSGNIIATNVSGLFVKPTTSTFYILEQTVCGQYSRDTVHVTVNSAVPLTFTHFALAPLSLGEGLGVRFSTTNEINVAHFNIQFSTNGKDFVTVGTIAAKNNNYNEYSVVISPPSGVRGFYRIEAVDKDGKLTYSNIQSIVLNNNHSPLTIYPNPAKETIAISFSKIKQIIISNIMGKVVKNIVVQQVNNTSITISNLPKGLYVVKVLGANGTAIEKLVVE
ncbi:MAG: T9SS type A sorting domain-containing protein [Chitinophagaceae bacterium]|jgi:hypothetical protein|nr:T9SS type A sorting domain-containing protein [Chitinophagaceae bacterium]MBP9739099.1 T9SS type A sorting domain-containing protein [Chitinophagaceae bacterium]